MADGIVVINWTQYDYWTIIKELPRYIQPCWDKKRQFLCKCKCWIEKAIPLTSLRSWKTTKCQSCRKWKYASNWKWWKTSLAQNIRGSKEYKNWRTKCFERDWYTCQISGQKWWDLVVHHLDQFSIIINDINNNLLFDINNWITITKELHNKFHNKYWMNNFTKNDFYEFLNNN